MQYADIMPIVKPFEISVAWFRGWEHQTVDIHVRTIAVLISYQVCSSLIRLRAFRADSSSSRTVNGNNLRCTPRAGLALRHRVSVAWFRGGAADRAHLVPGALCFSLRNS